MDTIFMNSKNNKTSDPHRLTDKIDSRRKNKYIAWLNLSIYHKWKNIKNRIKTINLKYISSKKWRIWITWWNILYIQYYFEYILKKRGEKIANLSVTICIN